MHYAFEERHAQRIGHFAAKAKLPVGAVIDLLDRIAHEESAAEELGLTETTGGLEMTVVTLRVWASTASFPAVWSDSDVLAFCEHLAAWNALWGVMVTGRVVPLVIRWANVLLAAPDTAPLGNVRIM